MKMTFTIIVGGALFVFLAVVMVVVFIPGWVWNPPQTIVAHPYTDLEKKGQELYYSNGCDYCHTQYVRYWDVERTGPVSQGGNYVFDQPMVLGSERTGPDLSYIGRKRDEVWEIEHLKNPREYSPMSLMPRFDFLGDENLKALGVYLYNLGDRVAAEWMIQPPVDYLNVMDPYEPKKTQAGQEGQGWPTFIESGLFEGKTIYIDRCQTCHGCAGNGLGTYAGTKVVTPANYKVFPFNSMPDDQWFWHVSEGIQGSVMPPWKESLTVDQRWKVIRYIQDIFANPSMHDPQEGDPTGQYAGLTNPLPQSVDTLDLGKHIFIRECRVCHGDSGQGEGPYGKELYPGPPDFNSPEDYGTMQNPTYTDADYYWRISEGVPWTAMPVWKERYSETDRWALTYYIRVNFTQTLPRPATSAAQVYPPIYEAQQKPVNLTADEVVEGDQPTIIYAAPNQEMGKGMFTFMCAHCHGFTGQGTGWDGQYLDVKPANFTVPDVKALSDGDWFSRVSFGVQNSPMPTWGEWMPLESRWNVIDYIQKNITQPRYDPNKPTVVASVYGDGTVPIPYAQVSLQVWVDEGHSYDPKTGQDLYQKYCTECHGADGGMIPLDKMTPGIGWPAALPKNMNEPYIYWRIFSGIDNTLMPPFNVILSQQQIWDITAFIEGGYTGTYKGGP